MSQGSAGVQGQTYQEQVAIFLTLGKKGLHKKLSGLSESKWLNCFEVVQKKTQVVSMRRQLEVQNYLIYTRYTVQGIQDSAAHLACDPLLHASTFALAIFPVSKSFQIIYVLTIAVLSAICMFS